MFQLAWKWLLLGVHVETNVIIIVVIGSILLLLGLLAFLRLDLGERLLFLPLSLLLLRCCFYTFFLRLLLDFLAIGCGFCLCSLLCFSLSAIVVIGDLSGGDVVRLELSESAK